MSQSASRIAKIRTKSELGRCDLIKESRYDESREEKLLGEGGGPQPPVYRLPPSTKGASGRSLPVLDLGLLCDVVSDALFVVDCSWKPAFFAPALLFLLLSALANIGLVLLTMREHSLGLEQDRGEPRPQRRPLHAIVRVARRDGVAALGARRRRQRVPLARFVRLGRALQVPRGHPALHHPGIIRRSVPSARESDVRHELSDVGAEPHLAGLVRCFVSIGRSGAHVVSEVWRSLYYKRAHS